MKKTVLHPNHLKLGAKMVEYAGFEMPIQYTSIKEEHFAVRQAAGVFDVSHMGEIHVIGKEATDFMDKVFTNQIRAMTANQILYGFLLYENGGVVDDLLVYKMNDEYYLLVVNASNTEKDFAWLKEQNTFDVEVLNQSDNYAEIALQGPKAEAMLQTHTAYDLSKLSFFTFDEMRLDDLSFLVSRTGYTGEDGFEIYGDHEDIKTLFQHLLIDHEDLKPCGLGARDTLRFEVALPLYGHEIDQDITPLEAGYKFAVDMDKTDFIGKDALLKQKEAGLKRRLVGLEILSKGIVREGALIYKDDEKIGYVTTGYMSPSLNKAVALALIDKPHNKRGNNVQVKVRKRFLDAKIVKKKLYNKS